MRHGTTLKFSSLRVTTRTSKHHVDEARWQCRGTSPRSSRRRVDGRPPSPQHQRTLALGLKNGPRTHSTSTSTILAPTLLCYITLRVHIYPYTTRTVWCSLSRRWASGEPAYDQGGRTTAFHGQSAFPQTVRFLRYINDISILIDTESYCQCQCLYHSLPTF